MLFSKKWTTIAESIIVMLIVVVWVVGMYNIFTTSQKMSDSTWNRLAAIAMAREWIEAVNNIRDTNWILFAANNKNCWFTLNYDERCLVADGSANPYMHIPAWSYRVLQDINSRWVLSEKPNGTYASSTYRNDFRVFLDAQWFYTQSGWTLFNPLYTREIKVSYPPGTPPEKANIESIVRWTDASKQWSVFEVKLQTTLTNWKKD